MTDLTARTFGQLTVLKLGERKSKSGRPFWLCRCACGNEKEIICDSLVYQLTKSCGCLQKCRAGAKRGGKRGAWKEPET